MIDIIKIQEYEENEALNLQSLLDNVFEDFEEDELLLC